MGKAYGSPFSVPGAGPPFAPSLDEAAVKALVSTVAGLPHLWRVEAVSYSTVIDPEREWYGSTPPRLELFYCSVKKWTPHGATLYEGRWVDLRPDRKQWASRTPSEALAQFIERRKAQIHILERQLRRAKTELALADPPESNGVAAAVRSMKGPPTLRERPY